MSRSVAHLQEEYDVLEERARAFLPETEGFTCVEQGQIALAYLMGRPPEVLGILPTGKGKSLCHLLPTRLWTERGDAAMTVVVSPILALMQDQVDALESDRKAYGHLKLKAAQLNSSVTAQERRETRRRICGGDVNVLYLGPETLVQPWNYEVLADAAAAGILRGLVIDEAHMIAEWGDEFRTGFKRLGPVRRLIAGSCRSDSPLRTLVLTATLPRADRTEVLRALGLAADTPVIERVEIRDEHRLLVKRARNHEQKKKELVKDIRRLKRTGAGIIYCAQRKHCEEIASLLRRRRLGPVAHFHGGTSPRARREILRQFQKSTDLTVVATDAFGLGVDKADVRWVLHFSQPDSIDQYYQEIGRGGRDGKPCEGLLYYTAADRGIAKRNALKVLTTEKFDDRLRCMRRGAISVHPGLRLIEESTIPDYAEIDEDARHRHASVRLHASWNYAVLVRAEQLGWLSLGPDVLVRVACEITPAGRERDLKEEYPLMHCCGLLGKLAAGRGRVLVDLGKAASRYRLDPRGLQREFFGLMQKHLVRLAEDRPLWDTRILVEDMVHRHARLLKRDRSLRLGRQRRGAGRVDEMAEYARTRGCRRKLFFKAYGYPVPASGCGACDNCLASS